MPAFWRGLLIYSSLCHYILLRDVGICKTKGEHIEQHHIQPIQIPVIALVPAERGPGKAPVSLVVSRNNNSPKPEQFLLWNTAWQSLVSNFKIILWLLDDARCHSDLLILLQASWSQARDWLVVTRIDGDTSTLHWQSIFAASTYGPNMFGGWFSPLHSQTMSSLHWERLICVRFTCSTTCVFYSTGCRRSIKARWHAESDASLATSDSVRRV